MKKNRSKKQDEDKKRREKIKNKKWVKRQLSG